MKQVKLVKEMNLWNKWCKTQPLGKTAFCQITSPPPPPYNKMPYEHTRLFFYRGFPLIYSHWTSVRKYSGRGCTGHLTYIRAVCSAFRVFIELNLDLSLTFWRLHVEHWTRSTLPHRPLTLWTTPIYHLSHINHDLPDLLHFGHGQPLFSIYHV